MKISFVFLTSFIFLGMVSTTPRARAEGDRRPEKPSTLANATKLIPVGMVLGVDQHGNLFCKQIKRAEAGLPSIANLDEQTKTIVALEIKLSKVVCDEQTHFVGFPDSGNRNEKFLTDFYTITLALSMTSGFIQRTAPGVESMMAQEDMESTIKQMDANLFLGIGGYKKAFEQAYDQLGEAKLQSAFLEYQSWADALQYYYREK